jgi:hypothetical protein
MGGLGLLKLSSQMGQSYPAENKIWLGEVCVGVNNPVLIKKYRLLLIFSAGTEDSNNIFN